MVDLTATAQSVDVKAVVQLQGPATDPKLQLRSEPPLPQDEVLSRLMFGRSAARITPFQGLQLAAAVEQLQGGGTIDNLLSAVRRTVGVDTLDVESDSETGQSTATAGKYITNNVFVQVQRAVQTGATTARVSVDLTPNLSVNTQVDQSSRTGFGLQWRHDY
jgi:autotransporter translocation and assembly factor TamB